MKKNLKISIILLVIFLAMISVIFLFQKNKLKPVENNISTSDSDGPVIESVTPNKAVVGSTIELRGKLFSGFEGDKYAWIENSYGEKGIIYGDRASATDGFITFKLEDKYCTKDVSYSGEDCLSYVDIIPGNYKIYVSPWGKESNKVDFKVI